MNMVRNTIFYFNRILVHTYQVRLIALSGNVRISCLTGTCTHYSQLMVLQMGPNGTTLPYYLTAFIYPQMKRTTLTVGNSGTHLLIPRKGRNAPAS